MVARWNVLFRCPIFRGYSLVSGRVIKLMKGRTSKNPFDLFFVEQWRIQKSNETTPPNTGNNQKWHLTVILETHYILNDFNQPPQNPPKKKNAPEKKRHKKWGVFLPTVGCSNPPPKKKTDLIATTESNSSLIPPEKKNENSVTSLGIRGDVRLQDIFGQVQASYFFLPGS